jgi:4-hydroxy-2-oxoheptanedioate aldolase
VQVETPKALDQLEAIAAVDGVDAVFIGPSDLSAALGHRGNPGHPEVQAAIENAIARIRAAGKPVGILAADEKSASRYISLHCSFIALGSDVGLLSRATQDLARKFKAAASTSAPTSATY